MATDFSKVLYHVVEEQLSAQLGERKKQLNKYEWRALMDKAMEQFAWALVAIVANFTKNIHDAQAKAEAEKSAQVPAEAEQKDEKKFDFQGGSEPSIEPAA